MIAPRVLLVVLVCGAWFLVNQGQTHACSCVQPGTPSEELAKSTLVFAGKVLSVAQPRPPLGIERLSTYGPRTVEFEMRTLWKGDWAHTLTLETAMSGASCGYSFINGQEYIVYSRDGRNVSLCSRTQVLGAATADLAELGEGSVVEAIPPLEPAQGGGECVAQSAGAGGDTVLLVLLGGLILMRRLRG